MARARTCDSCSFYVERTGFLTTHFECQAPSHTGSRRVKAAQPACDVYRSALDLRVKDGLFSRGISNVTQGAKQLKRIADGEPQEGRAESRRPAHAAPTDAVATASEQDALELEVAAAEARAEAAEARARAAEARAAAAEARARAARRS